MSVKVQITTTGQRELEAFLERLPVLVRSQGGPQDTAIRAANQIVLKRARQLAPVSKKTGTEKKQSRKSREQWSQEVRRQLASKVKRYDLVTVGLVGAKHPYGNAAHFMQEKPRRHVLWGKASAIRGYRVMRNWIVQAFEETRSQQLAAIEVALRKKFSEFLGK